MTDALRSDAATPRASVDRRQFVLGGALLATAGAAYAMKPKRVADRLPDGVLDRAIPKTIGPYSFLTASGLVLPPSDEMTEQLYDQVLTRVYTAEGLPPVMLLIAYGSAQDYTLQAHLPEVCYPSSGYTLTALDRVPVTLRPGQRDTATTLTAERPDRIEQVFYWMRIGNRFPASLTQERIAVVMDNLAGRLPDGILVRMSTLSPDGVAATRQLQAFNTLLLRSVGPVGRKLLGTGA